MIPTYKETLNTNIVFIICPLILILDDVKNSIQNVKSKAILSFELFSITRAQELELCKSKLNAWNFNKKIMILKCVSVSYKRGKNKNVQLVEFKKYKCIH